MNILKKQSFIKNRRFLSVLRKAKLFRHFKNFPLGRNKKAQITVFIIVGIIILAGVGLYTAVRREAIKEELALGVELAIEEVPVEFRPVSSLVENCLTQIATEGLTKLGERGGFIDLVRYGINTREDNTNSDAVQFSQGSEYSVPYWWYLSSDNECGGNCQFSIIPEDRLCLRTKKCQPSIESQLEDYIEENLRSCLNNFKEVKEQGFKIEEKEGIEASVTVAENDIIAYVDYPIEAEKAGKEELSKFFVRLPLNIRRIYSIAKDLSEMEGQYHFLERDVLNLIVGFSDVDKNKLPPMSETKFRIGKMVTWRRSEVKENIKNMLISNIQLLQVYGTRNYEEYIFPGNSLLESLYNRGMLVPGSEEYSDLEVKFNYNPFWNIYFNLNCDGEICRPESVASDLFALIGIQNYNFVYDLSFPVEVEIYDPYAFNNRGYRFRFFLEGNIRANDVMETDFTPIEGIFLEATMLCDENKRTSGDITINVKDYITNQGIDDVQIAYSSYEENCLIGSSENGIFEGKFPVMLGGTVSFLKDGYISYSQRFDTKLGREDRLDIALKPKLTKKFIVKKRLMTKYGNMWTWGSEAELREDEEALVMLTRKGSLQEGEFTTSAIYLGNQTTKGEIEIAPGTYDITINLMYNKPIKIPESIREYDDDKFTIQEFNLGEGFRVGGLSINDTFTKHDLKNDEIVFYVLNPDIAAVPESQRVVEDLNVVSNIDELSQKYRGSLIPKFK